MFTSGANTGMNTKWLIWMLTNWLHQIIRHAVAHKLDFR